MNHLKISDKFVTRLAYFYIGFPFLIFLFGWLQWYFSIPLALVFLFSNINADKSHLFDNQIISKIFAQPKAFLFVFLGLLIFIFFSGIGSYSFQNEDHHYRNAIFQDLIKKQWPVLYQIKGFAADNPLEGRQSLLVYYLGFWLPAAIIGKLFGIKVASFFLYLWAVLGLSLLYYFLCKYFQKYSWKVFALFLAWGCLYFLGGFYTFPLKDMLKGDAYLWAGNLLYADGNTGLIYWTFNQTITPWLIILLIMNQLSAKNILFQSSLLFFTGPFTFIGFIPFIVFFIFKTSWQKENSFSEFLFKLKSYFSFQNIGGSLSILVVSYLYFSANSSGNVFNLVVPPLGTYLIFVFLSIGIISILLFDQYKKNLLYYLILAILLVLPFFQLGFGIDLTARASIPALFILMLLAGNYIIYVKNGWRKTAVLIYLIISGLGHNLQFARSLYFTSLEAASNMGMANDLSESNIVIFKKIGTKLVGVKGKNLIIKNKIDSLNNPNNELVRNFMGLTDRSIFYKYLAKKPVNNHGK